MNGLPPVAPSVLADVLDELPPRLRKRVDAALPRAADWQVTVDGDQATAPLDDETTLTWSLTNGVLATADALVCSCLLAPRCLHRGIAVAAAETAEPPIADSPTEAGEINTEPTSADSTSLSGTAASSRSAPTDTTTSPSTAASSRSAPADIAALPDASADTAASSRGAPADASLPNTPAGTASLPGAPAGASLPSTPTGTATSPSTPASLPGAPADASLPSAPASSPGTAASSPGAPAGTASSPSTPAGTASSPGTPAGTASLPGTPAGTASLPGTPAGTASLPSTPTGTATSTGTPTSTHPGAAANPRPAALFSEVPTSPATHVLTEAERAAAGGLWAAAATVLRAGASGSGTVVRAELLRAVHQARVAGLHRAAASGLRVAAALAAARSNDASFDRAVLTDDLLDLLLLCHDLRAGTGNPDQLRGTARREYRPVGSLRLYGLCTEAVIANNGYGGVVTHLVDTDGLLWTIPAIMPGGAERVPAAANGPVAVGESGLTHRALGRAGLVLSGGTASPDRRLGAGQKVRAVAAKGVAWNEPPVAHLWQEPLTDQVARAFAAHALPEPDRPAGADLLFLDAELLGAAGPALRVAAGGTEIDLTGDTDRTRQNLRVLAAATGTRLRVIARLLPHQPGTATALAVQGDALTLPKALNGTVHLAFDQLQRSHVPAGDPRDLPGRRPPEHQVPPPLHPLRNLVHRIALAGRSVATATSSDRNVQSLTANGLTTTAAVLSTLSATTHARHRDAFGRTTDDHTDDFPRAWLTAALHLREFTTAAAHHTWLST